jgi:hypothetical protein
MSNSKCPFQLQQSVAQTDIKGHNNTQPTNKTTNNKHQTTQLCVIRSLLLQLAQQPNLTRRNTMQALRKIPNEKLGVSEPNPRWFGNPSNDPENSNWTNENWYL